jgi:hypothetical protein
MYSPLQIKKYEVRGLSWAMEAMRLPKQSKGDTISADIVGSKDLDLASKLIKAGDDHAKAIRGIIVWLEIELQVGFMIEFETYRHGVECLSTSSSMHFELKKLKGVALAEKKQADLPEKVYSRIFTISYQALRNIYKARRNHRHPDWKIFCTFIESLPYFNCLIYPEIRCSNYN